MEVYGHREKKCHFFLKALPDVPNVLCVAIHFVAITYFILDLTIFFREDW